MIPARVVVDLFPSIAPALPRRLGGTGHRQCGPVLPSVAGRRGGCGGRRGARQLRCVSSRRELVFGRPRGTRTMMQPCASAAKLRGGGPILHRGSAAMLALGSPPPRTVIGDLPRECGGAPKLVSRECV